MAAVSYGLRSSIIQQQPRCGIQHSQSGAEDVQPIVTQVQDHEARITDLEHRQGETEQPVQQQGSGIQTLQQASSWRVLSSSERRQRTRHTNSRLNANELACFHGITGSHEQCAVTSTTNPRTITSIYEQPDEWGVTCRYTVADAQITSCLNVVIQPKGTSFQPVGEILK